MRPEMISNKSLTILATSFLMLVSLSSCAQKSTLLQYKQIEYRKTIEVSRMYMGAGYGFNTNGGTALVTFEYHTSPHITVDLVGFNRLEKFNGLRMRRSGAMLGVKNSVLGYLLPTRSYLNLGAGISMMNQSTGKFETSFNYSPILLAPYLSSELFYKVYKETKLVIRFDQFLAFGERFQKDRLKMYHIVGMLRIPILR